MLFPDIISESFINFVPFAVKTGLRFSLNPADIAVFAAVYHADVIIGAVSKH